MSVVVVEGVVKLSSSIGLSVPVKTVLPFELDTLTERWIGNK